VHPSPTYSPTAPSSHDAEGRRKVSGEREFVSASAVSFKYETWDEASDSCILSQRSYGRTSRALKKSRSMKGASKNKDTSTLTVSN